MMPTEKPRAMVTFLDFEVYEAVIAAAAVRGVSVSAWLYEAARVRLVLSKRRKRSIMRTALSKVGIPSREAERLISEAING